MESDSFFDARTCYEDGLRSCSGTVANGGLELVFSGRIDTANIRLAEINLLEAECAYSRGDIKKAIDHLQLVKALTADSALCKKADELIVSYSPLENDDVRSPAVSSCGSCTGSSLGECSDDGHDSDDSLPVLEYYELLIQQLPEEQCQRYALLGEDFAHAYIAASRDEHKKALTAFENCFDSLPHDIYWYEKGKVLHRLGNDPEAEKCLRKALELNNTNSLAWLTLALVLRENLRFQDVLTVTETMIAEHIVPEQALLLRADILEVTGDHDGAVNLYVELLHTPFARAAAEKLYVLFLETGREGDAATVFKKYLKKSCH